MTNTRSTNEKTLTEQWIELTKIGAWIADQLPGETDAQSQAHLFEAWQLIEFATIHLRKVKYRTGGDFSNQVDQPK
ncbi:hypothetical protein [Microcoleus sp. AR_TQ3_B6]|uniref:hypothetical protein n=1 Tax=Microcoleus sp. AR_TQ3_B6 TaxID=3055284 RepID=UPI002FD3DE1C